MKLIRFISFASGVVLAGPALAQEISFAQQISHAGLAMVAILALSVLAGAVAIERLLHFRRRFIIPDGLDEEVLALWRTGSFDQVRERLAANDSTLSHVISYMLDHRHDGFASISRGAGDIASLELRRHQQKFYALSIVATVAPIVGLLGTVLGMIESFHVIAYAGGMGDPALLAGGISKALVNTAGGLTVALPALCLHHFFKNRLSAYSLDLEKKVNRLIDECIGTDDSLAAITELPQAGNHAH